MRVPKGERKWGGHPPSPGSTEDFSSHTFAGIGGVSGAGSHLPDHTGERHLETHYCGRSLRAVFAA